MPWIIKLPNGFVKSGKLDTDKLDDAKKFASEKQAYVFAQTNMPGMPYLIIELHEVYDEPK